MKFKIGNIVKISDTGCVYPGYKAMAEILGADIDGKWKNTRLASGRIGGLRAEVLNIKNSKDYYVLVEIIDDRYCGEQYVIAGAGLKLDSVSKILSDDLFEI